MEVYFLDVGQATCHVILLGGGRAVVVDCGGKGTDTLLTRTLTRFRIHTIVRLIISHNHEDHVGGATTLLSHFEGAIEELWFLTDDRILQTHFWSRVEQQLSDATLDHTQLRRLERTDKPKVIYSDLSHDLSLSVYSPDFATNLSATATKNANATSAIICLDVGNNRIIFGGDAQIEQWKQIRDELGCCLRCDVLAVPHHAGHVHGGDASQFQTLFRDYVCTRIAIVSVGTSNQYGMPRSDVVASLRANGSTVMCTQLTQACFKGDMESLRPGILYPGILSRSSQRSELTSAGNSKNLACAGTVLVNIDRDEISVDRLESHQRSVDRLAKLADGCPLCR